MAITVPPQFAALWQRLTRRPLFLLLAAVAVIIGLTLWQGWELLQEKPVSSSSVASQRLHIDQARFKSITDRLDAYHAKAK